MIDKKYYHGVGMAGALPNASVFISQTSPLTAPNE
jgi:hypothetical protein